MPSTRSPRPGTGAPHFPVEPARQGAPLAPHRAALARLARGKRGAFRRRSAGTALLLLIFLAAASPTAGASHQFLFAIGTTYGDHRSFAFRVGEAGCILARIPGWSSSAVSQPAASELALFINGANRPGYYARRDGRASPIVPLWVSHAVTSAEAQQVQSWKVSVANFTHDGTAQGTVLLEYPPTILPCELSAAQGDAKGQIILTWRYTARAFQGTFAILRSTDGRSWLGIDRCSKPPTTLKYLCTDAGLESGRMYYYRAAAVMPTATATTPAVGVPAP